MWQADALLAEIEAKLPRYALECKKLPEVGYLTHVTILRCDYDAVMKEACELRRGEWADTRARAIELAFDFAVHKAVGKEWERTGEVCVNKKHGFVQALCAPIGKELTIANR